jgi:uncharacterized protein YheU (UPF0270 family)
MATHIIPVNRLSPAALQGVIQEFVLREGTDYGDREVTLETKFRQVKNKLEKGLAVLVFDDETESTNIISTDNPLLKRLQHESDNEG